MTTTRYGLALLPVAGFAYEYYASCRDEKEYHPIGELVDVGGYRLHIHCQGQARHGVPTVILESGIWCCSLDWQFVQPEIAKLTQVVSYDRAGYGWSEKRPGPRTFKQIAYELKILLKEKGINPPYIFVGHSSGGAIAQYFQTQYPEDVIGLILVDALTEEPKLSGIFRAINYVVTRTLAYSSYFGALRWLSKISPKLSSNPTWTSSKQIAYLASNRLKLQSFFTYLAEWDGFKTSFETLKKEKRSLGDKPIIVICRGDEKPVIPGLSKEKNKELYQEYLTFQKELLKESNHSELRFAVNSGHMIQLDQPEVVINAIQDMMKMVKI